MLPPLPLIPRSRLKRLCENGNRVRLLYPRIGGTRESPLRKRLASPASTELEPTQISHHPIIRRNSRTSMAATFILPCFPPATDDQRQVDAARGSARWKNVWRAVIEIGFIIFVFYSNLLMGEFERSGMGQKRGLTWAIGDVFTAANFEIATIAALIGYILFEFLRKRS
jgi:hypothetical protein